MSNIKKTNISIWENLYKHGKSILEYPDDIFVRLTHKLLKQKKDYIILDYGFGAGANMLHLLKIGFDVSGIETSKNALEYTRSMLTREGFPSTSLRMIDVKNATIPSSDSFYCAVVAWHVLYYNDKTGFLETVKEIIRVLKKGGIFIGALKAPGDHFQTTGKLIAPNLYNLGVPDQEGATVLIPEEEDLYSLFCYENIRVGYYNYVIEGRVNKNWIVIFEKK